MNAIYEGQPTGNDIHPRMLKEDRGWLKANGWEEVPGGWKKRCPK